MKANIVDVFSVSGEVRTIMCDGKKYPEFTDVDIAIKNGEAEISDWKKNIIPVVGRTAIARRLRNARIMPNEGMITFGAVGTGTTVPASSDNMLSVEFARKLISSSRNIDNMVIFRVFFTTAEANATLREFGLFGEHATELTNSGTLFERVLINRVKTSAKTLTIEARITIT